MKILRVGCMLGGFLSLVLSLSAQTFTILHSFDNTDGEYPIAGLVQATDGDLWGTTSLGGADGNGTVFKITSGGKLTTLYNFCSQSGCTDGYLPGAPLVQATNGDLYGIASAGGADGNGTVFKITSGGNLTTLYSFCSQSGCPNAYVSGGLVQATNGNFYGATGFGGTNNSGTVFKITAGGKLTTLYSFCSQSGCTDGAYPYSGLVQATNGNFYGTTTLGGVNGHGTVFKITPSGKLTTLHSFDGTDGANPTAMLVQGTNGNLYGTTCGLGPFCNGGYGGDGTVFKMTPSGKLTTLHSFDGTDGANPFAALVQGTDGNFYGATGFAGAYGSGTVFKITPRGKLTTLYSFTDASDGANVEPSGLVQATNGNFYGTTYYGGANDDCSHPFSHLFTCGTVFSLSVGLGPFVETNPTSSKVGAAVKVLGTDLTGATGVSFNGTAAKFIVVSKSELKTRVPVGATTGKVKVKTPQGSLVSNVNFRVVK
jgi:uncharacterized repeat protein (TIGR03803 family)